MDHIKFDNFVIKTPETKEELTGLYDLNNSAHNEITANDARKIIETHPDISAEHFLIVKDLKNDKTAATLSMFPWDIDFFGIDIKTLEQGFVATDIDYKKRGLQRKLNDVFMRYFSDNDYDLSVIQGIPGFYGNFGYHYAIPLENRIYIELRDIKDFVPDYAIRKANNDDCALMAEMYKTHVSSYDLFPHHKPHHYSFMMNHDYKAELDSEFYIVSLNAKPAGYFKIMDHGFGEGLNICEVSGMTYEAYLALLAFCKKLAMERGKPCVRLNLPEFHELSKIAYSSGGCMSWSYEWQVKLNIQKFIRKITPVIEKRIADSMFKGISHTLELFLYSDGIAIEITNGRITAIDDYWKQQEECAMSLKSFHRLVLGCETAYELNKKDHEMFLKGMNLLLLDVMFPMGKSYLYMHY